MTDLGTSPKRRLGALAFALAIGAAGGVLFLWLDTPLPWMIGAMVFTTVAALAGARIEMPQRLRSFMIAVLGVMLGSQFTPDLMERVGQWPATLASLVGYVALAGGATYVYLRRAAGLDRVTAYFAASPGGLNEMIIAGAALGADDRTIALVHASRVLLIVLTVPFWFRLMEDYDAAARVAATATGTVAPDELLILVATGVVGVLAARALRLPAATLAGPMLASALAHLTGLSAARPPAELVAFAQVVMGAGIGCRFAGADTLVVLRTLAVATGATVFMLAATVAFALGLHAATGLPTPALVLAFAPGGLAEMSLVALALGTDAAFVSTHHVVRIMLVVILAPLTFGLVRRLAARRPGAPMPD